MHHRFRATIVGLSLVIAGCRNAVPPTAPNAMLVEPGPSSMAGSGVLGSFVGVGHTARGSVLFTVANGVGRLEFSADFSVSAVPGPFVYLNTTSNANTGRPLRVAALRSNSGAQSYVFQLPAGESYAFVLVWCDPYNVPVAEARLPAVP